MFTVQELDTAIENLTADGYHMYINTSPVSSYSKAVSITLSKTGVYSTEVRVTQTGDSFQEALERCLANFPKHPLDGSSWKNNRLEAPKTPEEEIIDVDSESVTKTDNEMPF